MPENRRANITCSTSHNKWQTNLDNVKSVITDLVIYSHNPDIVLKRKRSKKIY